MVFSNIEFAFVYWFLLVIPVIIFFLYFVFSKKKAVEISSFVDVQKVYKHHSSSYYMLSVFLFLISVFFVFLIARPQEIHSIQTDTKNGIDIALVLDVSLSMEAQDLSPSRIEVAKSVMKDFINSLSADRVTLVLFSGRPFAALPMNFDYGFIISYIDKITTSIINQSKTYLQGTALWDAMMLATKTLDDPEHPEREQIMILITDGEANNGIDPNVALKYVKEKNIKVYTIGVGWLENTTVKAYDALWRIQNLAIGWVDEKTLKAIAQHTWGKYYRATDKKTLENIFSDIQKLEKKEIETEVHKIINEKFDTLIIMILLLIGMTVFLLYYKDLRV